MRKLEHYFRLQSIISSREKKLEEDFPPDLLRIWTDFKTPVTIGKGGLHGEETSKQPHNLALVTVHGLMLQYRHLTHPTISKSRNAFAMNLCEHAVKQSCFTYQHILHSLSRPEIKKISITNSLRGSSSRSTVLQPINRKKWCTTSLKALRLTFYQDVLKVSGSPHSATVTEKVT